MAHNIIIGAKVNAEKLGRARELRQNMTPGERMLWERLRGNQMNRLHFRRRQVIDGFLVDFYCHAAALVIEVDGGVHELQPEYDAERASVLQARGHRILRLCEADILADIDSAMSQICSACQPLKPSSQ